MWFYMIRPNAKSFSSSPVSVGRACLGLNKVYRTYSTPTRKIFRLRAWKLEVPTLERMQRNHPPCSKGCSKVCPEVELGVEPRFSSRSERQQQVESDITCGLARSKAKPSSIAYQGTLGLSLLLFLLQGERQ